jgi:hypothetical protein
LPIEATARILSSFGVESRRGPTGPDGPPASRVLARDKGTRR